MLGQGGGFKYLLSEPRTLHPVFRLSSHFPPFLRYRLHFIMSNHTHDAEKAAGPTNGYNGGGYSGPALQHSISVDTQVSSARPMCQSSPSSYGV